MYNKGAHQPPCRLLQQYRSIESYASRKNIVTGVAKLEKLKEPKASACGTVWWLCSYMRTSGSDDRIDLGMLLQGIHALFLVQIEADALLYQMVNLKHSSKATRPVIIWCIRKTVPYIEMIQHTYHPDVRCWGWGVAHGELSRIPPEFRALEKINPLKLQSLAALELSPTPSRRGAVERACASCNDHRRGDRNRGMGRGGRGACHVGTASSLAGR